MISEHQMINLLFPPFIFGMSDSALPSRVADPDPYFEEGWSRFRFSKKGRIRIRTNHQESLSLWNWFFAILYIILQYLRIYFKTKVKRVNVIRSDPDLDYFFLRWSVPVFRNGRIWIRVIFWRVGSGSATLLTRNKQIIADLDPHKIREQRRDLIWFITG